MKTLTTNRHSATSHFAGSRKVRGLAIACALLGATLVAQSAAGCTAAEQQRYGCRQQPPPPRDMHTGNVTLKTDDSQQRAALGAAQQQPAQAKPPKRYRAKNQNHLSDPVQHIGWKNGIPGAPTFDFTCNPSVEKCN